MTTPKKPGIFSQAFEQAAQGFIRDKDDFGVVTPNDVGAIAIALALAALLYTVVAGKSLVDVLMAGLLATMALAGVALMKFLSRQKASQNDE